MVGNKMPGESKLDSLATLLEKLKISNETSQKELQTILKESSQVLQDYRRLKQAEVFRGKETNGSVLNAAEDSKSYVLVLVDGNGYIFNDELILDKEEGGMRAARMLNNAVEQYLVDIPQVKDARIIVRVYADLTNLSKLLAKSKLTGLEKRSLAAFAAGFTRAIGLFDFVDALDEEGTKLKIRENFKLAAEDSNCSHILYAACHDPGYLSPLVRYTGQQDKITLVQGTDFKSEFHTFGLNLHQFPTLFRWSTTRPPNMSVSEPKTLTGSVLPSNRKIVTKDTKKTERIYGSHWRKESNTDISDTWDGNLIKLADRTDTGSSAWNPLNNSLTKVEKKPSPCKYFQKGFCRFGDECHYAHIPSSSSGTSSQTLPGISKIDRSNISSALPTVVPVGSIALNKNRQRIDAYMRPPNTEEWSTYNKRFHRQKPCNAHHLQGNCMRTGCPFDHSPLEPESQYCLEYVVRCGPCPKKGGCRAADCILGHLCQKDGCLGKEKGCKMKADMHSIDPSLAYIVPAEKEEFEAGAGGKGDGGWCPVAEGNVDDWTATTTEAANGWTEPTEWKGNNSWGIDTWNS